MKPKLGPAMKSDEWRDLRDARGKLCARIDTKRMVLEIKRSDRALVATFDLRDYLVDLRVHTKDESK
jgi:hypothetical protein